MKRLVTFGVALCAAGVFYAGARPGAAQPVPALSPIPTPIALPSLPAAATLDPLVRYGLNALIDYANREKAARANSARGTVAYFKRFDLSVETSPNRYRAVKLHRGTIIDPRGATLAPGQHVDVSGTADADGSLEANAITIDR